MQGSISLQSDIEMIRTRIRQCVEPEDSNGKVKDLESSLLGEIRMATYSVSEGATEASYADKKEGGILSTRCSQKL